MPSLGLLVRYAFDSPRERERDAYLKSLNVNRAYDIILFRFFPTVVECVLRRSSEQTSHRTFPKAPP
jgi:hypothetical protein